MPLYLNAAVPAIQNCDYSELAVNLTNPADSIQVGKSSYSGFDLTKLAVYKVITVSVYTVILTCVLV